MGKIKLSKIFQWGGTALAIMVAVFYWKATRPIPTVVGTSSDEASASSGAFQDFPPPTAINPLVFQDRSEKNQTFGFGKPILIHYWASWCAPCVVEWPKFAALVSDLAKSVDAVFLAVTVDVSWQKADTLLKREEVQHFLKKSPLILLRDTDSKTAELLNVSKFPETLIIDRQGRLIRKYFGPQSWDKKEMKEWLLQNLK